MRKSTVMKCFVTEYYGNTTELHSALRVDRLAVQFEWECFVDGLCRDGLITIKQYETWTFPW